MEVTLIQHAVGQGGMMSGRLTAMDEQYHWVYDCGSDQMDPLRREIKIVTSAGTIDVLFISHLDSDHINGIDRLLSQVHVRQVVLPYLDEIDRLIAVAHDVSVDRISTSFTAFVRDIELWFSERGVEVLTYLRPQDTDGELRPEWRKTPLGLPRRNGDQYESSNRVLQGKWLGGSVFVPKRLGDSANKKIIHVQGVEGDAHLQVTANGHSWLLAPFAHRPSDAKLDMFKKEIDAQFSTDINRPDFPLCLVDDATKRDKLRDCYDKIWSTHNLVSMALYSGPAQSANWVPIPPHNSWHLNIPRESVGWLGTGDMHLNVRRRRKAFLGHYEQVLHLVGTLVLPHHGSRANFDIELVQVLPSEASCIASSGPNTYGHPSEEVEDQVRAEREYLQVSNSAQSRFRLSYAL